MVKENIFTKGMRIFQQGKVCSLGDGHFEVLGDHGTYEVRLRNDGGFSCGCNYNSVDPRRMCSHIVAAVIFRANESIKKPEGGMES